ncbi:MAG: clostripain-related cysteine peptidase, partial [Candidatus Margulisiibacteriota bacterium]|jgi:hypothetical protein
MTLFVTLSFILLTIIGCGQTVPAPTQKQWTIMFYAAGDNDLDSHLFNSVVQLQKAGSTSQVNIVAETDWWHRQGAADTLVTGEGVGRWYIEKSDSVTKLTSTLVESVAEINTGTATSVKDFVIWAAQKYPAQHYMLVMTSHGGGWRTNAQALAARGVGQDYTSDPTKQILITLPEFKAVLPSIKSALGKNIDIFACDSCLNGMVEFAYQFKDHVDILVASEENVPGTSFPWDTIAVSLVADPTISAVNLAKNIVNLYYTAYTQQQITTLAAIDLSKITAVVTAIKELAPLFDTTSKDTAFKNLVNTASGQNYSIQRYGDVTFRDIWDMADKIITNWGSDPAYSSIVSKCATIKTAVESAVLLSKYTSGSSDTYSVANSHGLSLYIPTPQTTAYDTDYTNLDFTTYTGWGTFLQKL